MEVVYVGPFDGEDIRNGFQSIRALGLGVEDGGYVVTVSALGSVREDQVEGEILGSEPFYMYAALFGQQPAKREGGGDVLCGHDRVQFTLGMPVYDGHILYDEGVEGSEFDG